MELEVKLQFHDSLCKSTRIYTSIPRLDVLLAALFQLISAVWLLLRSAGVDPVPCGEWVVGWLGGRGSSRPARQPLLMSVAAGRGDSVLSCVPLTSKPLASAGHKAADQLKELNLNLLDDSFECGGGCGGQVLVGGCLCCRCLRRSVQQQRHAGSQC